MTVPKPPISPDVDLRDFAFMPLDVTRLADSDLALTVSAEAFRAAVLLWGKSWHQVPAGSLPDNDIALARLAQTDPLKWLDIRDDALHGFYLCDDERFYHSVVVEKAKEAWEGKERYRKAARKRWKDKRKLNDATHGKLKENLPKINMQVDSRQGQLKEPPNPPRGAMVELAEFEKWYDGYPRKVAPGAALKAYRRARKKAEAAELLAGVEMYRRTKPDYADWKHPATWLNGECWLDEAGGANGGNGQDVGPYLGEFEDDLRTDYRRLMRWQHNGEWMEHWGPKPGEPDCQIATEVMDKYGPAP